MQQIRSRVEVVLLWAQLILVLGDAVSIAQGLVSMETRGHAWVTLLPLVCVLPAAAAFRETRAAAIGVTAGGGGALARFGGGGRGGGRRVGRVSLRTVVDLAVICRSGIAICRAADADGPRARGEPAAPAHAGEPDGTGSERGVRVHRMRADLFPE